MRAWDRWLRQPAWTIGEFAKLCCGWDPGDGAIPDPIMYAQTVETIRRAVWVQDPDLPVRDVRWGASDAQKMFDYAPVFTPSRVWQWAQDHYPDTSPYSSSDFVTSGVRVQLPSRVELLLRVMESAPNGMSQKEIQQHIATSMRVDARTAQAYAALFRSDEAVLNDNRARRRRSAKPTSET